MTLRLDYWAGREKNQTPKSSRQFMSNKQYPPDKFLKDYDYRVKIQIIAHPNSKRHRIEKDLLGTLHIYVNAPPLEGKANNAVIESLVKYFNVKKSNVILISGEKSKTKTLEIIKN